VEEKKVVVVEEKEEEEKEGADVRFVGHAVLQRHV
jgi:hypothetical protein